MLDEKKPEEVAESMLSFPPLFSLPALSSSWVPHKMGREGKVKSPPQSRNNWDHNSGHCQLHGLKEKSCTQKAYLLATVYVDFNPRDTVPKRAGWRREGIMKLDREQVQRTTAIPHHCTADASTHLGNGFLVFYQNSSTDISFLLIIMIPLTTVTEK